MVRDNLNDLAAFVVVAQERSFTRAAGKLGVSQSALSHAMRGLEERLGLRLLTRTTRSVAPTDAGARLLATIAPRLREIEAELSSLTSLREWPAGTVRITATDHAARTVLWPALHKVLPAYPDIAVEIVVDYALRDIVRERFDAGIRYGGTIARDMVAVPVGPDMRMAAVASPAYFAERGVPATPQDLMGHTCINLRLPTLDSLYAWEFERDGREFRVRVDGQLTLNSTALILDAALGGFGIAYLPEDQARSHLEKGELIWVLQEWSPPFAGYHLYYPSRRQNSAAFGVLIEALRYRS